jgi:hypothetical protein
MVIAGKTSESAGVWCGEMLCRREEDNTLAFSNSHKAALIVIPTSGARGVRIQGFQP